MDPHPLYRLLASKLSISSGERSEPRENARASSEAARGRELWILSFSDSCATSRDSPKRRASSQAIVPLVKSPNLCKGKSWVRWVQLELTDALGLVDILEFMIGWDCSFVLFIVSSSKSARNALRFSEGGKWSYSVHSQEACFSLQMSSFSEFSPVVWEFTWVKRGEFELLLLVSSSWDETWSLWSKIQKRKHIWPSFA